ncbi:MAG: CPBP family intramembrane glutamic endopeptidase, partial [Bdellovibrionota bacterium]
MIGNWIRSIRKARAKRRANVVAASSVALQVIYLYAGQPKNFEKWFGDRIEDDDLRELLSHVYERFFAYGAFFVVPAAIVKVVLGESLSSYGLRVGKWWKGLPILAVGLPAATASAWYAAGKKEFQDEYPLSETARRGGRDLLYYEIANFHYYIGWEFFYRGYLQHGLEGAYGVEGATAFQTVASTLMHIGKPFDETAGAGFAGPLFG